MMMIRVRSTALRLKQKRCFSCRDDDAARAKLLLSATVEKPASDEQELGEERLSSSAKHFPATKSLLNEIIQQQRKLLPNLPPRPRAQPSNDDELVPLFFGTNRRNSADLQHSSIPMATKSSLFDVFQLPDPPVLVASDRSPNAFPAQSVKQYWEILKPILKMPKFQRKQTNKPISDEVAKPVTDWLQADEPCLSYDLPTFQRALKEGVTRLHRSTERNFPEEVALQRQRFRERMGFSDVQIRAASGCMLQVTNMCARNGKGLPLDVVWEKVKEAGMTDKALLHNLLYVSATFSTGSVRSRRKRRSKYGHLAGIASILDVLDTDTCDGIQDDGHNEVDDLVDLTDEIAIYHDLLYEPTEQSINVRVKLLVAQGKAKEAESLLNEHSSGEAELRLRAYTPVLRLFLELDDLGSALKLYKNMRTMSSVHLDVETFIHLIAGFAEKGKFCSSAEPIEGALELGYRNSSGPGLFDEIVEEMATEIFEISESSAKRLYNALASGFPDSGLSEASVYSLRLTEESTSDNELFAKRVFIDPLTGLCPGSGLKLRLIHLEEHEKEKLVGGILSLARLEQNKFQVKHKALRKAKSLRKAESPADQNLLEFYNWLDRREGEPFTILVDGANVGYYHQNYEDGRFSYHQIKFVVDFLENQGENPLVVIPYKYSRDWFNVSPGAAGCIGGRKQNLTRAELAIRNDLMRRDKLLLVPPGHLGKRILFLNSVFPCRYFYLLDSLCSIQTISIGSWRLYRRKQIHERDVILAFSLEIRKVCGLVLGPCSLQMTRCAIIRSRC